MESHCLKQCGLVYKVSIVEAEHALQNYFTNKQDQYDGKKVLSVSSRTFKADNLLVSMFLDDYSSIKLDASEREDRVKLIAAFGEIFNLNVYDFAINFDKGTIYLFEATEEKALHVKHVFQKGSSGFTAFTAVRAFFGFPSTV